MIWGILITIILFIIYKFVMSSLDDKSDLQSITADKKFQIIVNMLNDVAFDLEGKVTLHDKYNFNLYNTGSNQIIQFSYKLGMLHIEWRYKYFQKEVVHSKTIDNARNLSIFEQQKIANQFILEMDKIIETHQDKVAMDSI